MKRAMEGLGKFVGEHITSHGLEYARRKVEQFDVQSAGLENLLALKDRPYLMAANHVRPEGKISNQSGLAPDALILEKLVAEATNRKLRIVAKSDDGWAGQGVYGDFQKKIGQPFGQGNLKAAGLIPIKKNPGSFNRDFLNLIEQSVRANEPILIFPEGEWRDRFDPAAKLEAGAGFISEKYDLPIVPAYIEGAVSWKEGQQVKVLFGQHFEPGFLEKDAITEKIRENIAKLQTLAATEDQK